MSIKKAVITAAGLGTRLLSATKEMPKEMLPLFATNGNCGLTLKPVLQMIFEQLYDIGIREFCFIVGRGKRSVEDHFTPDYGYIDLLMSRDKAEKAVELKKFYGKVESSLIVWINQPEPKGFGDAVLKAELFVNNEPFLVHAGDTYIISRGIPYLQRLIDNHSKSNAYATLVLKRVRKVKKLYGVAEVDFESGRARIKNVVEKPEIPASNLAIMPVYAFEQEIFNALKKTSKGVGGEIQLTDAIQKLIDGGSSVEAIVLENVDLRLDVGTPETYWEALHLSFQHSFEGLSENDVNPCELIHNVSFRRKIQK